ncbi:MAG: ATP-binding protein [Bacteroidota bacterium]
MGTRSIVFLGVLLLCFCLGCNTAHDNLEQPDTSTDSLAIWVQWARDSIELSQQDKTQLLEKALQANDALANDSIQTQNLSRISLAFSRLGDTLNFKRTNAELMALAKKTDNALAHGEAHWDLGSYHRTTKPDSAYYHFKEAHMLFSKASLDTSKLDYPGRMLVSMASTREKVKDYIGAEKDVIKAIEYYNSIDQKKRLYDAHNLLAITQDGLNKSEKALEYYKKAKEFIPFLKKDRQFSSTLQNTNNSAAVYLRKKDYSTAYEQYQKLAQKDSFLQTSPQLYAQVLSSMAISQFKSGQTEDSNAPLQLLQRSNAIFDSLGANTTYYKARNHEYLAEIFVAQKDTLEAISEASTSVAIAKKTLNNDRLLSSLKLLTTIDRVHSAAHARAYFDLNEQLQLQERNIQDKFARIQLETDEAIERNAYLARQKRLWTGIALGMLLLGIAIFTIIAQRINNQRLRFQQRQQESNQEIYNLMLAQQGKFQEGKQLEQKRISEEIHDGILGQMLGIRLILSGLNERDDASAIQQRAELIEKMRELEEEIRTISHELNDASYQKIHNFIAAIDDLVKTISASAKLECDLTYDTEMNWDGLDGDLKINMYRIVQESLQNCVKHANCNAVLVNFTTTEKMVMVMIKDDGVGFDTKKGKKGIGLKNVISRVGKLSGTLKVDSTLGEGTAITVQFPKEIENVGHDEDSIGEPRQVQEV